MKLEFVREGDGYGSANIFARYGIAWRQVAVWRPLFRITAEGADAPRQHLEVRPLKFKRTNPREINFSATALDTDSRWNVRLKVALEANRPVANIQYEWTSSKPRQVRALLGPNLYIGDDTAGPGKTWGLFPGLEYLYGPERSSNPRDFAPHLADRRTPHPHKITIPLMAVTVARGSQAPPENPGRFFTPESLKGGFTLRAPAAPNDITVALLWDPLQKWDGEHAFPSARFVSPNSDEKLPNHRIALFLPSCPEFVPENSDQAAKPFALTAGKTLSLEAALVAAIGPAQVATAEWLRWRGGLPKPNPWPRSFQAELDICRAGFLNTVWDAPTEKWRHCIDWASSHAPGFAALLWLDSNISENPAARQLSHERVELAVKNMLRDGGPGLFVSQANCHIMQWEFPFLHGYLPEALAALDPMIKEHHESQQPDGGWRFQPGDKKQVELGQAGDSVLGTCANRAANLLRYARITGDAEALAAGERALQFMERFRVPRGGQTWECPMYEPDILPAGYAIRAYLDGYRITQNLRWLDNAVYWAETGVPFVYLWTLPDKPMMLGATIPVFGSTFYTHTWLGVPVQWCGLVYAYHLYHLAEELEQLGRWQGKTERHRPLALHLSPADWKRVVELITVSAMYQQYDSGDRVGAYPDSISQFEKRNPAFLNPEDILVNVLALKGYDPDIKTHRIKTDSGEVIISSAAQIRSPEFARGTLRFRLEFFKGQSSHSLVSSFKPRKVKVNGLLLREAATPLKTEPGWWWDQQRRRLYLSVNHSRPAARIELMR